jgi:hypothetical protein
MLPLTALRYSCDCSPHESSLHASCVPAVGHVVPGYTASTVSVVVPPHKDTRTLCVDAAVHANHTSW